MPISIRDGKFYLVDGDLKGTLGADGTIALNSWAVMCIEQDAEGNKGEKYGSLFNVFSESSLVVPNITVSCNNVAQDKLEMYMAYVDQPSDGEADFYNLINLGNGVVASARVTSDKRIVMSPQLMYNNMYYGPFYNYPATLSYDDANSKWKISVNSKGNMVFTLDQDGNYVIDAYAIAAKANTSAVGYAYKDVVLALESDMRYPAAVKIDMPGTGSEADPYQVRSISDITAMSQACEGGESFEGVYFKLTADLDYSVVSPTGYIPVGTEETPFAGSFDGNGKKFSNVVLDGKGFNQTAIFGVLGEKASVGNFTVTGARVKAGGSNVAVVAAQSAGRIHDVDVELSVVDCDGELGAGIVANATGGEVENCSFRGNLTSVGSGAGIAAQAVSTTIRDCHARANLVLDGASSSMNKELAGIVGTAMRSEVRNCFVMGTLTDKAGYGYVGGLIGYMYDTKMTQSFNTAAISASRAVMGSAQSADDGDTNTGGLVAYISESEMTDCYNAGTIIKTQRSKGVGGLIGYLGVSYVYSSVEPPYMKGVSTVKNCYNSGQIISTSTDPNKGIFGNRFVTATWTGDLPEDVCISDCYYDGQINSLQHEKYSMKTADLTGALPSTFDSSVWEVEAGKYPVLKNTGIGSHARELSAAALTLRPNDNAEKVKVGFALSSSANTSWMLNFDAEAGETATETSALKMDGSAVTVKDKYANSVIEALTADGWGLKLYRLSVVPKVFDGEGTSDDPYLIKVPGDFAKLDEAVGTYGQAHIGDFFTMTNDIDFAGGDEFHGVGYGTSNEFRASFDGRGFTVKGLKIDAGVYDDKGAALANKSLIYNGLFGIVGTGGSVRNVIIGDDCDFTFYSYGGSVAGLSSGVIENCKNYATINGISNYNGGIVGVNYDGGVVRNCYNAGAVYFGIANAGGIAGYNRASGVVENCQNDGNVFNKVVNSVSVKTKSNTAGGIVGYNYGAVASCVNNGQVRAYNTVGGIVGTAYNDNGECSVSDCVNNALVTAIDETLYRGGLVGKLSSKMNLEGNYYDASINVNGAVNNNGATGATGLSSKELVSGSALDGLDAEVFDFKAGSYPVLKAYADEPASKALRSLYIAFEPKVFRTNVIMDTPVSTSADISMTLESGKSFSIDGGFLKVVKPEGNELATDSLTAMAAGRYVKTYNLSAIPTILNGDGTQESPYLIETPEDWNKLADFMEKSKWEYSGNHFRITQDLDFKGDSIKLLAVNGVNFNATLDGDSHTVKNYVYKNLNFSLTKLEGPNYYKGMNLGLIGTLGSAGTMKNMVLDGSLQGYRYLGSAVGDNYGHIEGITHKGTVETIKEGYVGGIAYKSFSGSSIVNCENLGNVISIKNYAFGIVYETQASTLIENCANHGRVEGKTGTVAGIAYKIGGTAKGCVNDGELVGSASLYGIAFTVDKTARLEDCVNRTDIDLASLEKPGTNAVGLIGTLTARTEANIDGVSGYVINCHNYGDMKAKSYALGAFNTINEGWTIENCSNEGDVTVVPAKATDSSYAYGFASSAKSKTAMHTIIKNCYNSGDVIGQASGIAGMIGDAANYTEIYDCYNLGNVTNSTTNGLTTAGLVAKHNGVMERCFNTGDVVSAGNAVGGLVGYMAAGANDMAAAMRNCFNIGNVTSTYTGTNSNGNAGGIGGYLSTANEATPHEVVNCFNTGNVTANKRVAGLFAGAFRPWSIVKDCYNSGKITCLEPDGEGRYYWSGTTFTNSYKYNDVFMLAGHSNCFYDVTVNPGSQFRDVPGSAKTTQEMRDLQISEAYVSLDHKGYPVLKEFAEEDASHLGSALILIADKDGEAHDNITDGIALVGPAGAEWYAVDVNDAATAADNGETAAQSTRLSVKDGMAYPTALGKARIYCEYNGLRKNFDVNVTVTSGISDFFGDKEVKSVEFIDLQGRSIAAPAPGSVYIMRTVYTDGTMKVEKRAAVD